MDFTNKYTTSEKIAEESTKKSEEKTGEAEKTILSNEAYAIGEMIQNLINKIEHARISLIK